MEGEEGIDGREEEEERKGWRKKTGIEGWRNRGMEEWKG